MNDSDAQGIDEMKATLTDVARVGGNQRPKLLELTEGLRIWDYLFLQHMNR